MGRIGVASSSTSAILSAHTCGESFEFEFGVHDHPVSLLRFWCCLFEFSNTTFVGGIGEVNSSMSAFLNTYEKIFGFEIWVRHLLLCMGFWHSSGGFHPVSLLQCWFFGLNFHFTSSKGEFEVVSSSMSSIVTHVERYLLPNFVIVTFIFWGLTWFCWIPSGFFASWAPLFFGVLGMLPVFVVLLKFQVLSPNSWSPSFGLIRRL